MSAALLEIDDVVARYGQIEALRGVSLMVGEGEAVALVGANGAGKSTLMKCLMGLLAPASGSVRFAGKDSASVIRPKGDTFSRASRCMKICLLPAVIETAAAGTLKIYMRFFRRCARRLPRADGSFLADSSKCCR